MFLIKDRLEEMPIYEMIIGEINVQHIAHLFSKYVNFIKLKSGGNAEQTAYDL